MTTTSPTVHFLSQETTTLIVKNLPNLPEQDIHEFLRHFGAQDIRILNSQHSPHSAFIDYPDRHTAATAFQKISSLEPVYGKKIRVEYALPSHATLVRDRSNREEASEERDGGKNEAGEIEILQNITSAIAAVPRLYTQVLHLMNKMNLPPPFGPVYENSVPEL
ncbi:719_t:CDS:2, partial [Paraglomus brasilianum]